MGGKFTPERAREYHQQWAAKNPDYHNLKQREYRRANPEWMLHKNCKNSARTRGHVCELTLDDVKRLCAPMVCSVTGLALSWAPDGTTDWPWAPSIDRLDRSEGYTADNVRLVCWALNRARGPWGDEVFDRLARAYMEKSP